ncbi:hypothetical protein LCGC14_2504560 [marine sediment metagenome]|uniref:Uncharacterized protein n=1 Tax=marine sediment metagenome TaxID=412755 RepID=A0A0F9DCM1_9ZZZZ
MAGEFQGWSIHHSPSLQLAQAGKQVFSIPKERNRVVVKACTLTPQEAVETCTTLLKWMKDNGMLVDTSK